MPIQQMLLGGGPAPEVAGQAILSGNTTAGTWTVPDNVYFISVVCIGTGGKASANGTHSAGGGGCTWANSIPVTPGATLSYEVHDKWISNTSHTVLSGPASGSQAAWSMTAETGQGDSTSNVSGGGRSQTGSPGTQYGGSFTPGGSGGNGHLQGDLGWGNKMYPGGGGAAGYGSTSSNGSGANGGKYTSTGGFSPTISNTLPGAGSTGGGGGGGFASGSANNGVAGGGGGASLLGNGTTRGAAATLNGGAYGSPQTNTPNVQTGSFGQGGGTFVSHGSQLYGGYPEDEDEYGTVSHNYGGGAGAAHGVNDNQTHRQGGPGAIRIMWPGDSRAYPNTRTADE